MAVYTKTKTYHTKAHMGMIDVTEDFQSAVTEACKKYNITAGTVTVSYPAYTIWRLSLHHRLWSRVTLTTAIDNLFDYRPAYYYLNAPLTDGITLMIAAKIKL